MEVPWPPMEGDPYLYTQMLRSMGATGVKVEELYTLTMDEFERVGYGRDWRAAPSCRCKTRWAGGSCALGVMVQRHCCRFSRFWSGGLGVWDGRGRIGVLERRWTPI